MIFLFKFTDLNGYGVTLSFKKEAFEIEPTHILILAKKQNQWLLTNHPKRGLEFPGGKVEVGETLTEAVIREAYEETGATLTNIEWFASYYVQCEEPFVKAVYTAEVQLLDENFKRYETLGAVLCPTEDLMNEEHLSFYMKDAGMKKMLEKESERV